MHKMAIYVKPLLFIILFNVFSVFSFALNIDSLIRQKSIDYFVCRIMRSDTDYVREFVKHGSRHIYIDNCKKFASSISNLDALLFHFKNRIKERGEKKLIDQMATNSCDTTDFRNMINVYNECEKSIYSVAEDFALVVKSSGAYRLKNNIFMVLMLYLKGNDIRHEIYYRYNKHFKLIDVYIFEAIP